jgi:hypothetical protein
MHDYAVHSDALLQRLMAQAKIQKDIDGIRAAARRHTEMILAAAARQVAELEAEQKRGEMELYMQLSKVGHERHAGMAATDHKGRKIWPPYPHFDPAQWRGHDQAKTAALRSTLQKINALAPGSRPALTAEQYAARVCELDQAEEASAARMNRIRIAATAAAVAAETETETEGDAEMVATVVSIAAETATPPPPPPPRSRSKKAKRRR